MSITIFTTPKAFKGMTKTDQYNAIISWKRFSPDAQIILIGDDDGTDICAKDLGVEHIPACKKNDIGTPFLDSIFHKAQEVAQFKIVMYINADIVFTHDITRIISALSSDDIKNKNFLATGQRHDTDCKFVLEIDKNISNIEEAILNAESKSKLHGPAGLDYFIFRKDSLNLPPFLIGRPCWDNWLLWFCYNNNFMIISLTNSLKILHQNHDFNHVKKSNKGKVIGPEWDHNVRVAGGYGNLENLRCHTHHMNNFEIIPKPILTSFLYKIYSVFFGRSILKLIRHTRYLINNR